MKRVKIFLILLIATLLGNLDVYAQCKMITTGLQTISETSGCAPFTLEIRNLYNNVTPDTEFRIDWGDGESVVLLATDDPIDLTPDFIHTYEANEIDCGYTYTIEAVNGCTLAEDARVESSISVWDTDHEGLSIGPETVRVCQGFAASVTFEDLSDWNCFPRTANQNDPPRFIQWVYNSDPGSGLELPSYGAATSAGPIVGVMVPGELSDLINVPVLDPNNPGNPYPIGASFEMTLNNWNQCNPQPLDPITTTAQILIVGSPEPDFVPMHEGPSNPPQYDFCLGDIIYFDNETPLTGGASLVYTWEFYDGPNTTDLLLGTKTTDNPVFSFATGGQKLVRLIAGDNNAVGGCSAIVEKVVRITPTAIAQIGTANTSFCKTQGSTESFDVTFTDETVGSISGVDEWRWELYDENDALIKSLPAAASTFIDGPKQSVMQTYTNPGVYRTKLIYRDKVTQCDTYDEINIVIYNNPEPLFASTPVCEGDETLLIDETTLDVINANKVVRWEWDFYYDNVTFNPDSIFDVSRPDTLIKQFNYGVYQIALRATNDQNGCSAIFTESVDVFQNPIADFTKDLLEGCSPLSVTFENTISGIQPVSIDEYIWCIDYGSGYVDTLHVDPNPSGFSPEITTTFENWSVSSKAFKVILKSISEDGCVSMSEPDSVKVLPSVKPGFTYVDYEPLAKNCAPVEVDFQVDAFTMSLLPENYTWIISDGIDTIQQATYDGLTGQFAHTFTAEGKGINNYTINLQAEINDICVGDSTLSVNVNPIPISNFTIDTLEIDCDFMTIEVNATQKGLVDYDWTITKGNQIFMNDTIEDYFVYRVQRPGPTSENLFIKIDLATANYAFCESSITTNSIFIPSQPQLNASFIANPEIQVFPNSTVALNNTSTRTNPAYSWDFGDGETSDDEYPQPHKYERPGNYTIKLQLEEKNCESVDSVNIFIQPTAPIADFSFDPGTGCVPLTVNFTNLTKYGDPEAYRWYFGEGEGISTTEHPTHTYYEPGVYSVKLEATNESGVIDAAVKRFIIEVFPVPHADFSIRPETVKLPEDPIYTTNLSFEADFYLWDFGDGGKSDEFEPSHIYLDTGRFDISLIASTEKGCMDTVIYENVVEVIEGNEIQIPNAFTPSLDGPTGGSRFGYGRNDIFYPVTEGVIAYKMQIYNRWGELLFDTEDSGKGWDGYYNGRLCAPDVYIYKIDFKFYDGREVMKFGDIALIR